MQAVYPTIVFFQLIPKVALAPVFLLWFGTGFAANVIFSVFIAFFPVVVATITGLQAAPPSYEGLCRGLMMSRLQIFAAVKFPFALPHIFSGLRIGVTFAVIGVVLGEFITAQTGLGYIILFSANNFETALSARRHPAAVRRRNRAVRLLPRAGGHRHAAVRQPLREKRRGSVLMVGQAGDLRDQLLGQRPAERLMSFGNDGEGPEAADDVVLEVFLQAARRIGVLRAERFRRAASG